MRLLDLKIGNVEFSEAKCYRLRFEDKYDTSIASASMTPVFEERNLQCQVKNVSSGPDQPNFTVSVLAYENQDGGNDYGDVKKAQEIVVAKESVFLNTTSPRKSGKSEKDASRFTFQFAKAKGHLIDGSVEIRYKFSKKSLPECIQGDQVHCISIQAAHLNKLLETPFDLKIAAKAAIGSQGELAVVGTAKVSHENPNSHLDIAELPADTELQLILYETAAGRFFRVVVTPDSPMVVTVPMPAGDPLVLSMQCLRWQQKQQQPLQEHEQVGGGGGESSPPSPPPRLVTGSVHSCTMREATVLKTPGSTGRRYTLSPRRRSSFDHTAAQAGLLGTSDQAIPSTKKTLLFIEDMELKPKSTSHSAIIGGIQCAEEVDDQGKLLSADPIVNHHGEFLAVLKAAAASSSSSSSSSSGGVGGSLLGSRKYIGPNRSAYLLCSSKSDVLESSASVKKVHKKQTLSLNLGVVPVAPHTTTNPVRMRTSLVDLHFSPQQQGNSNPDAADNPEAVVSSGTTGTTKQQQQQQYQQKALIAYMGVLEETSRELFNETGFVSVTLEGKLFKPSAAGGAAAAAAAIAATAAAGAAGEEEKDKEKKDEEQLMTVKVYLSLVPSSPNEEDSEEDAEAKEDDEEEEEGSSDGGEDGEDANGPKQLLKQNSKRVKNAVLAIQPTKVDFNVLDREILEGMEFNIKDKGSVGGGPFNVVTADSALPGGELAGSSMLSVPTAKLSAAQLAAQLHPPPPAAVHVPTLQLPPTTTTHGDDHDVDDKDDVIGDDDADSEYSFAHNAGRKGKNAQGFGEGLNAVAVSKGSHLQGRSDTDPKHAAATGVAFAEVLKRQLDEKQQQINDLQEDVRARSEAIQVCGFDIRSLREDKIKLMHLIEKLEAEKATQKEELLKADKVTADILQFPKIMQELDKPTLIHNMHKLRHKINTIEEDRSALQQALHQAKDIVEQFAALKKEHHTLQEAYQAQTQHFMKMQGKINQVEAYKKTMRTQEKVIAKLQTVIESNMRGKNSMPNPKHAHIKANPANIPDPAAMMMHAKPPSHQAPDFFDVVKQKQLAQQEIDELLAGKVDESELREAKTQISDLQDKLQDLENQLFQAKLDQYQHHSDDEEDDSHNADREGSDAGSPTKDEPDNNQSSDPDELASRSSLQDVHNNNNDTEKSKILDIKAANDRIAELEAETTMKGYRISALEDQLSTSTKDYAREIARLRTKLFELEITAAMAAEEGADEGMHGQQMATAADANLTLEALLKDDGDNMGVEPAIPSTAGTSSIPPTSTRPPSGSAREAANALKSGTANVATTLPDPEPEPEPEPEPNSQPASAPDPEPSQAEPPVESVEQSVEGASKEVEKEEGIEQKEETVEEEKKKDDEEDKKLEEKKEEEKEETVEEEKVDKVPMMANVVELAQHKPKKEQLAREKEEEEEKAAAAAKKIELGRDYGEGDAEQHASGSADNSSSSGVPAAVVKEHRVNSPEQDESMREAHSLEHTKASIYKEHDTPSTKDPNPIDKTIEFDIEIVDLDQSAGKTPGDGEPPIKRSSKDNKWLCGTVTMTLQYRYNHVTKLSVFHIKKLRLHGFTQKILQPRYEPYLQLSYGNHDDASSPRSCWMTKTNPIPAPGATAEWMYENEFEQESMEKQFRALDEELAVPEDSLFKIVMRKKNEKAEEDFEVGTGTLQFTKEMFQA